MIRSGSEVIGSGRYKRVFPDAQNPEKKVVAEFRGPLSPEQIKSLYYLGKISHLLFPNNIPDLDFAGNTVGKSILRADRMELDEEHQLANILYLEDEDYFTRNSDVSKLKESDMNFIYDAAESREELPAVKNFVVKAYKSGLFVDEGGQNFSLGTDGEVKYLDLNPAWHHSEAMEKDMLTFDPDLLINAIKEMPDSPDKERALNYFKRLMQLIPK